MKRIVGLLVVPVGGVLLLHLVLGALYRLRGLALPEYVVGGVLVGTLTGYALMRVLAVRGLQALPWMAVAAIAWAVAAVLHDNLTALVQDGRDPFSALDWWVRTTPSGASHPAGRTFFGREALAGLTAALGTGLPILAYLPSAKVQRLFWWLTAGALAGAAWMLTFHAVWIA